MLLMDWLIRLEREDSLPRIVVRHLTSEEEHVIAFAEEAYSLGVDSGYEFATNLLRFNRRLRSGITTLRHANARCESARKSQVATTAPTTSLFVDDHAHGGCLHRPRTARLFRFRFCIAKILCLMA